MHNSIAHTKPTYEVACAAKGIAPLTLDLFSFLPENQRQAAFSQHRVETVCEYLKQGKEFDWNDTDQEKYYPWWDMETYGDGRENDGFVLLIVSYHFVSADVSARLCSFSSEDAEYLATEFREDYKNFMK